MRFVNYVPSSIRHEIVRKSIELPITLPSSLIFKIAETEQELEASFKLVYDAYLKLGYCEENPYKMRATLYHALPTTTTLLAIDNGNVVGTLTVVRDNRHGLPVDKVFNVKGLREKAQRLAEITSLVIHEDYRREKGGQVLFPLLRLMYEYSTSHFGVKHLVVSIHPKDVNFYKSLLLFKTIPETTEQNYLGSPAVALHLDLEQAVNRYQDIYSKRNAKTNLYNFFIERKIENIQLPKREFNKINDPIVSVDYFQNVFVEKLGIQKADVSDRRKVRSSIRVLDPQRLHPRIEVELKAQLGNKKKHVIIKGIIKDASRTGFRIYSDFAFSLDVEFDCTVEVGPQIFSRVKAKPVWNQNNVGVGFEITESDAKWNEFIDYLYQDQLGKAA